MTTKDREDHFIERCRKEFGVLSPESEILLRYGFATGADELSQVAFDAGVDEQQEAVLVVLGAARRKASVLP